MTNTPTGYESFKIPVERVEELEQRVAKINRRAAKLGTPPVSLILTDNYEDHNTKVGGTIAFRMGPVLSWTSREVLLKGETPKLNGWEFVGVVLHRPAGNEIVNVQDATLDLSEFTFTDKHCDHCLKNRVRNATFLVRHAEEDSTLQVGSSCLEDFTGVKSPQAHAKQLENIFDMFKELRGGGWTEGRTSRKFFVAEWLAWVSHTMRLDGKYVGRNRAYDTGESTTAEKAKRIMLAATLDPNVVGPTMEDYDRAEKAITWVRSDEGFQSITDFSPDFAAQLAAACASDDQVLAENAMGIVAPAIAMYERNVADAAKPVSQHLGAVKDKLTFTATLERSHTFETAYGFTTIYNFRDAAGNLLVWFSSRDMGLEVNESYTVTGSVKAHDTYRDEAQTVLTRCKVA